MESILWTNQKINYILDYKMIFLIVLEYNKPKKA